MRCNACGGVYHQATGHIHTSKTRICGPCARELVAWLRRYLNRRWGGLSFYEHAATSIRA